MKCSEQAEHHTPLSSLAELRQIGQEILRGIEERSGNWDGVCRHPAS
jgi:hypothetical protein